MMPRGVEASRIRLIVGPGVRGSSEVSWASGVLEAPESPGVHRSLKGSASVRGVRSLKAILLGEKDLPFILLLLLKLDRSLFGDKLRL